MLGDGIDIVGKAQGHDVSIQAVDHGAGLLARAAVGLLHHDVVARFGLPVLRKRRVKLLIKFACGIVGNVEERDFLAGGASQRD